MKGLIHNPELYTGGSGEKPVADDALTRLAKIAELASRDAEPSHLDKAIAGRSRFTRFVDRLFHIARERAGILHRLGARLVAVLLFIYGWLVAHTTHIVTARFPFWPYLPAPCVMAVWHGSAPSLLIAILARRPRAPIAIMVSRDPRGDCLALVCRMIGLRVVRGSSEEGGWEALAELAREVERGVCALITADGGGPAQVAKVGAVALAAATGAPLIAIGADCRPALSELHKWDRARIPLPLGSVAIAAGAPRSLPSLEQTESIEEVRFELQSALEAARLSARRALGFK
ncbi:MAG TPA: DUF374 domain-containing protein [Blastocatellia bacterium]|jgi:lysophospholipid acyltransferase (LPLAT)-like uncharacterized protein